MDAGGQEGAEKSERVHCACVIDASWLMAGRKYEKLSAQGHG